jgi:hypothetical protein
MLKYARMAILSILAASSLLLDVTGRDRRLEAAGRDEGWFRRKSLSAGLRSLPCKRRVGVDPRRKRWTEHRVLVNLLARRLYG